MSSTYTSSAVFACLIGAVLIGAFLRRRLPAHHLSAESKDAVKAAVGMVVTMAALVLGLLVASAKSAYDTRRSEITEMAAKIAFVDRVLAAYGPSADDVRAQLHAAVKESVQHIRSEASHHAAQMASVTKTGNSVYAAIERLAPQDDAQRGLKGQAASAAVDIGRLRLLLQAQATPSISNAMLAFVVGWLVVIFISFSLLAPGNATTTFAFVVSTISVAGAVFLVLELDQPFGGLIEVSTQPLLDAFTYAGGQP